MGIDDAVLERGLWQKKCRGFPVIHFVLLRQEDFVLLVGHESFWYLFV